MIKIDFRFDSLILMKPVNVLVLLPSSLKGKPPYKSVLMLHYALADAYTFSEQLNLFSIPDKYGCALIIPSLPNSAPSELHPTCQMRFPLSENVLPAFR